MPAADPVTATVIASYSPKVVGEEAARFARGCVAVVAPGSPARAKSLLFATSRLAAFGLTVGLEPTSEVLLSPVVIERFVAVGAPECSAATRRTLRTNLRFVAARVLAVVAPPPAALGRERAKAPYSAQEIDAYLALADAQPTRSRRLRASGLICLGAGAGLMGQDLRTVSGHDVVRRSGGLVVLVTGRRPRTVPVLSRYHERLDAAARFAGAGYVVGGDSAQRHNVTTPLVSSLAGGLHLSRLDTGRLRSTWLGECARAIGLAGFMTAAGISCSQRLGDIVATLEVPREEALVALLGGSR
jgi:hypothetical protein